jgi:hypothetical protein
MKEANQATAKLADDLVWGGKAIADEIGKDQKSTLYHLARGHIQGATKLGNLWVVSKSGLRQQFRTGG